MMAGGAALQMGLLAALLFTLASALVCRSAYPWLRTHLGALDPAKRSRALLVWSIMPLLSGLALAALCFVPSMLSLLGLASDHCLTHEDQHVHLCLLHHGHVSAPFGWLLLAAAGAWWSIGVGLEVMWIARARALVRSLSPPGRERDGALFVETEIPVAFTAGLVRPRVYLASQLVRRMSPLHLQGVIAHEQAHVRRRDGLRKLAASIFSLAHVPTARRRILADLALACEQACDAAGAARLGDRISMAEAVVVAERLLSVCQRPAAGLSSMSDSNVPARVEALLSEPAPGVQAPKWHRRAVALVIATLLAASADSLHHLTETVLTIALW